MYKRKSNWLCHSKWSCEALVLKETPNSTVLPQGISCRMEEAKTTKFVEELTEAHEEQPIVHSGHSKPLVFIGLVVYTVNYYGKGEHMQTVFSLMLHSHIPYCRKSGVWPAGGGVAL